MGTRNFAVYETKGNSPKAVYTEDLGEYHMKLQHCVLVPADLCQVAKDNSDS